MWKCRLNDTEPSIGCKQFLGVEWMYCAGFEPSVSRKCQRQSRQWAARPPVWQVVGSFSRSDRCLFTIEGTGINVCQTALWWSLSLCVFLTISTFYVLAIPEHYETFRRNWISESLLLSSRGGTLPGVLMEDSWTSQLLPSLRKMFWKVASRILGSAAHPMNYAWHCLAKEIKGQFDKRCETVILSRVESQSGHTRKPKCEPTLYHV